MIADSLIDAARWALVLVFVLAGFEKALALESRTAAWHPLLLAGEGRRRHATPLMGAGLAADLLAVVLLVVWPLAGAAIAAGLVVVYSILWAAAHAPGIDTDCRCFWKVMNASTAGALYARNFVLLVMCAAVAVGLPTSLKAAGFALGLLLVGLLALVTTLGNRLARSTQTALEMTNESNIA